MRVLVCGSRDWEDQSVMDAVLCGFARFEDIVIIEGGARGADKCAHLWAKFNADDHEVYTANWEKYGKGAGAVRNKQMLVEGKPDIVLAFKDGFDYTHSRGGTENMVAQAKLRGVPTYVVSHG